MLPASIGPYQILRELGHGGMGEVFLARDTQLDRQVAIKALPAHLSQDPDRLARFQREAKVLASLNHPGIGAIYGLERSDSHQYLILEFIEGETLADLLAKGPLPVDEALHLAKQIAEALEVAHEKGVIHRDLKPGNLMVTPEGSIKVLDFGLARTAEGPPSTMRAANAPDSPTFTSPMPIHSPTIPGVIMGTAGYMSPEQARGKSVDKRSDIFSFGCVLYEMLTGVMPFRGETAADAIGATLHKESDLSLLPPSTPPTIRLLLSQCLTKDKASRLRDIGDARLALAQAISDPQGTSLGLSGVQTQPGRRGVHPALAVAFAAIAIVGGTFPLWSARVGVTGAPAPVSKPEIRFTIDPPAGFTLPPFISSGAGIALSPAGDRIVFVAEAEGQPCLCIRDVASDQARVLPNTKDCSNPFFSPDGKWLGYLSKSHLMKMPADGGPALTLCDVTSVSSLEWLDDGTIVWGAGPSGLWRVSADGGKPVQLAKSGAGVKSGTGDIAIGGFDVPVRIPGADYILCCSWGGFTTEEYNLVAVSLKDGTTRTVLRTATEPRLITPTRLLFMRGTTAMTVAFDPARGVVLGEPTVALENIRTDQWMDSAYIGASRNGSFAYVPGGRYGGNRRIVRVDETGKFTPILDTPDTYSAIPEFSRDGRKAIISTLRKKVEMWVLDLERRSMSLVNGKTETFGASWSVDGTHIVGAQVGADGVYSLTKWPIGGGEPSILPGTSGGLDNPLEELPDGSGLLVQAGDFDTTSKPDIKLYTYATGSFTPIRNSPAFEGDARVSPDGKWITYISDESGRFEAYIGPLRASGPNVQVSSSGAAAPRFSPDGKRLFFRSDQGLLMAATIDLSGKDPQVSIPTKLFDASNSGPFAMMGWSGYGVMPDGGFVMLERAAWEREPPVIHVILNWAEVLQGKAAGK